MHVVQQETALAEPGQRLLHFLPVEGATMRRAFQAFHHPRLVPFRLQPADEPGAGVRQALVVEIDRVLGGEHQAEAVGARLLEQGQQQTLGRRVRGRRHVAEDLVHVEDRAQAGRARLSAHPGDEVVQQHGHKEHAFVVVEVRDRHHGDPRPPFPGIEKIRRAERLALHPGRETGRGQQVVEPHRQGETVLRREEGVEIHDADLRDRRRLYFRDQRRDVQIAPGLPGVIKNLRQ